MHPTLNWNAPLTGPYEPALSARHSIVIAPDGGEPTADDIASHRYHHHTRVAVHNGRVWVAFSSGGTNEDSSGETAAVAHSSDDGETFSAPLRVLPPQSEWKRDGQGYEPGSRVAYPRAFVAQGGALYLVAAIDAVQGTLDLVGAALVAVECRGDGTVGPPMRISAAAYEALPGTAAIAYDPALAAALFAEADRFGHWGGSTPGNPPSEWTGWLLHDGHRFAEPATFPLDADGKTWIRLWRLLSKGVRTCVYATISHDGGATYGPPHRTNIPNSPSSLAALRLSDGRIALVGNPMDSGVNRDPLYLAIFSGEGEFQLVRALRQGLSDKPTYEGWHKHGGASYPGVAETNGVLYVSYSMQKETIALTRLELAQL